MLVIEAVIQQDHVVIGLGVESKRHLQAVQLHDAY
jgi:hypothetical protein